MDMLLIKQLALAELDADPHGDGPRNALAQLISDFEKSSRRVDHFCANITKSLMIAGRLNTPEESRNHINGFYG